LKGCCAIGHLKIFVEWRTSAAPAKRDWFAKVQWALFRSFDGCNYPREDENIRMGRVSVVESRGEDARERKPEEGIMDTARGISQEGVAE
jgi:hypothetical protein